MEVQNLSADSPQFPLYVNLVYHVPTVRRFLWGNLSSSGLNANTSAGLVISLLAIGVIVSKSEKYTPMDLDYVFTLPSTPNPISPLSAQIGQNPPSWFSLLLFAVSDGFDQKLKF